MSGLLFSWPTLTPRFTRWPDNTFYLFLGRIYLGLLISFSSTPALRRALCQALCQGQFCIFLVLGLYLLAKHGQFFSGGQFNIIMIISIDIIITSITIVILVIHRNEGSGSEWICLVGDQFAAVQVEQLSNIIFC